MQEKLQSSSLPNKEDMVLFISELRGHELDDTKGTEEWTNAIDRGGLWHINDDVYTIFYFMEEVANILKYIQQHGSTTAVNELS